MRDRDSVVHTAMFVCEGVAALHLHGGSRLLRLYANDRSDRTVECTAVAETHLTKSMAEEVSSTLKLLPAVPRHEACEVRRPDVLTVREFEEGDPALVSLECILEVLCLLHHPTEPDVSLRLKGPHTNTKHTKTPNANDQQSLSTSRQNCEFQLQSAHHGSAVGSS